jgi:NADH-quinone oxidoreductase subunit N
MLKATIAGGNIWLAIFAVIMAAVSVYYYFRLIQAMYFKQAITNSAIEVSNGFKYTMVGVAVITIILGIFPNILTYWLYF